MNEHARPTSAERIARIERGQADAWTAWTADVVTRIGAIERKLLLWFGDPAANSDAAPIVMELINQAVTDVEKALDKRAPVASIPALREELQIEIGLLRDELLAKIESRIFGTSLSEFDPDEIRRAVFDLRADSEKRSAETSALLNQIAERVDSTDKIRKYDRNTSRTERDELAAKLGNLLGGMIARTNERVDKLTADLKELENRTAEAFSEQR